MIFLFMEANNIMRADIVIGAQYGDEAKGKIAHHLCKTGRYTHVIRFNGGCNAGHTIYHEGKKFVTHHIPAGVFYGIDSIIGPGCVIDPERFFKEVEELEAAGIPASSLVMIAKNAHVITDSHRNEDGKDTKIGTTRRGNGPAYRDKYDRKGVRAEDMACFEDFLVDIYEELHSKRNLKILLEGAQGFGLDIDHGDYPYVTSSHCTAASALLNGIPPQAVDKVWGVAKIYETYVGAKDFEPDNEIFKAVRDVGQEYGATTGRPRQCNWLNWDFLEKSVRMNGVTDLVFNKMDVLREIGKWTLIHKNEEIVFDSETDMKRWIVQRANFFPTIPNVYFSGDPNGL
jgi:adenylosuccinate synthase